MTERKADKGKKKIVSFSISDEDLALLDSFSEKEGRSRSNVMRRALKAYLKQGGTSTLTFRP